MTLSTLDFLRFVVPEQGAKFVCTDGGFVNGKSSFTPRPAGHTHEDMLAVIQQYLAHNNLNIYMALGGFESHAGGRKGKNARYFRSHWLDIDVGKKRGGYLTQPQAWAAVRDFIERNNLPKQSLVVSSGKGLHIYWCYDEDMDVERWQAIADQLKDCVRESALDADMSVIADPARVLRPVGTQWYDVKERVEEPKDVRLLGPAPSRLYPLDALEKALNAPERPPAAAIDTSVNDALMTPVDYDGTDSDPLKIAEQCAQMRRFAQSGAVEYTTWFNLLGVLKFCGEKGQEMAHRWSANGFSGYTHEEVEAKLASWGAEGATTCAVIRRNDESGTCAGCALRCNSPVSLGYDGGVKPVPYRDSENAQVVYKPVAFPDNAKVGAGGALYLEVTPKKTKADPDPEPIWVKVSNLPFYVDSIVVNPDGTQESDVVYFPRKDGPMRRFVLSHATAQSPRDLKKALNAQGIFVTPFVEEYVVSYIDLLKKHVMDTPTHAQMGWVGGPDEFLIGNTLIGPTETREVRVNAHLKPKASLFDASNKPEVWINAVDQLYNQPHGEPYQFALAAAFASVLVPVLGAEEFNGIPVALTSDESGYGKSTVCKIALAAFGKVERNLNVLTGDEVSSGAVEVQCSTFNCVPHLFDEMTNKSGQETSHILYMLSNGVARARLKQDGTPRPASPPWRGISYITGNKNIFLKLTESKVNPEAAQMRVFEIPLENYGKVASLCHASDFVVLTNSVRSGYGAVGATFIRHVMANRQKIHEDLWYLVNKISSSAEVRHDKERFYIYEIACVAYATRLLRELELVKFSPKRVYQWAIRHMASMRDNANEYQRTAEEDFSLMLAYMVGQGKVIATIFEDKATNELQLRGMPCLRVRSDAREAYLTVRGFLDYCREVSKNPSKFRQELLESGCLLSADTTSYALGKDVVGLALGSSQCYRLNYEKAVGPVAATVCNSDGKVVQLRREAI